MRYALILFALVAVLGWPAPSNAAQKVRMNSEFKLRSGKTALVKDARMTIRFLSVPEDSRCPEGVNCVWAGNGKVKITVSAPGRRTETLELNTTTAPVSVTYQNYDIKLVKLAPYPKSGSEIKPSDYVVTLLVTRKPTR